MGKRGLASRIEGASLAPQTEGQRGGLRSSHLTSAPVGPQRAAPHCGPPRLAHRLGAASHPGCHGEDRPRPPSLPPQGGPGVSVAKGPMGSRRPHESRTGGPGRWSAWSARRSGCGWGVPAGVTPSFLTRTGRGGPGAEGPACPPLAGSILPHPATSSGRTGSASPTPRVPKTLPFDTEPEA